jgi:hypothetical protein
LVGVAILGFVVGSVGNLWAAAGQKVGTLADVRGNVEIIHPGDKEYRAAKLYEDVLEKDRIRTGPASRVKILYDDDSMTILSENSAMEIRQYDLTSDKKRNNSLIGLLQGKIRFIVTKYLSKDKPNFSVQTPTAVMGVRGSDSVAMLDGDTTKAYHLFGDLEITNAVTGEKLVISSGQFAIVHPDGRVEKGIISTQQLEEILGFFARLTSEERKLYWDRFVDELRQDPDVLRHLGAPDLFPDQFVKPGGSVGRPLPIDLEGQSGEAGTKSKGK